MALKLIHHLDGKRDVRRSDLANQLLAEAYRADDIDELIKKMRDARLLHSLQGPHSRVWLT